MQTRIVDTILSTPEGQEADSILRACVHCGFCTATCPTYQLLGDELDGPRGRIYLMKEMLEGQKVSESTRLHLDRCLTCRSCETTCPSGVRYGRLLDIGRGMVERNLKRSAWQNVIRWAITTFIPYPKRLKPLLLLSRMFRVFIPRTLVVKIPPVGKAPKFQASVHARKMLVLDGCVQSVSTPQTNFALNQVMDKLGINLVSVKESGCCGGVDYHLGKHAQGQNFMRRNIDAWWPHIQNGVEAIIVSASGCGVTVKEYGDLLAEDKQYAEKARRVSELVRDPGEVLANESLEIFGVPGKGKRIVFHSPCTLQHGQSLNGVVESVLERLGFTLTSIPDPHLCCGSAGTYSLLQPEISSRLLSNKLEALATEDPQLIATANVGCQLHLGSKSKIPVVHWLELIMEK